MAENKTPAPTQHTTAWVRGIETAPYASTVLACYFDGSVGEWIVRLFVAERPAAPFTHWMHVGRPNEATPIESDLESLEEQTQALRVENERLRHVVSDCAAALMSAAFISPKASIEFMEKLPREISLTVRGLRDLRALE